MNQISFPGFGLNFNINPEAFTFLGKSIYWYGIIIAIGFLLAFIYGIRRSKEFGIKSDDLIDAALFALPSAIIGARLYYVLFSGNGDYLKNPFEIIAIWNGGLAIYGGIIAALTSAFFVCKYKKISKLAILDLAGLGLLIGQGIGRWGNFVNGEAYGIPTNLPWRMNIINGYTGQSVVAHPTFLYESLWCLLGFVLLHIYSNRRKFSGEIFLMYVAWYGLGRAFIEGLRTDSLYLFGVIRISQAVAILSCISAIVIIAYVRNKMKIGKQDIEDTDYVPVYEENTDVHEDSTVVEQVIQNETLKDKLKTEPNIENNEINGSENDKDDETKLT
jgi:phosphatidylglycerol:prolipoprotein diacylglycerol transferase